MLASLASPAFPSIGVSESRHVPGFLALRMRRMLGAALLLAVCAGGPGCPPRQAAVQNGAFTPLELAHSPEPRAEAAYRDAERDKDEGKIAEAQRAFRAFVGEFASDPLVPYAKLELGRIDLDAGNANAAQRWFSGLINASDPALRERAQMYNAIASVRLGRHAEALPELRSLVGRTVDPGETAALLDAVARAEAAAGNAIAALEARDRQLHGELPKAQRAESEQAVSELVARLDAATTLPRAYELLPRDGYAWPRVAERTLRESNTQGKRERVAAVADDMHSAGVSLSAELSAMVLRAERSPDADPNVIGAILPLSGRGREAGEAALHGLLLAAERAGKKGSAPRIVYRDDAGDPARAVAALDDLVSNHRAIAVVGPISAGPARAVVGRSKASAIPVVIMVPDRTLSEQSANVFRLLPSPSEEARLLVERAVAEGAKRFAIMHAQNAYGEALRDAFEGELRRAKVTTVQVVSYAAGATNFIKEAETVAKSNADAVIIADSASKLALLAPALSVHGLWSVAKGTKPPEGRAAVFLIPSLGFDPSLAQSTRRYLQGAIFAVPFDVARAASFRDAYRAEFQAEPNLFSAASYDAYQILRSALASGVSSRADLSDTLKTTRAGDTAGASDGFSDTRGPRNAAMLEMLLVDAFVRVD